MLPTTTRLCGDAHLGLRYIHLVGSSGDRLNDREACLNGSASFCRMSENKNNQGSVSEILRYEAGVALHQFGNAREAVSKHVDYNLWIGCVYQRRRANEIAEHYC